MTNDPLSKALKSVTPDELEAMRLKFQEEMDKSSAKHAQAAERFSAGLDKVVDVMLILVLKFGRATTMLLVIGALNIVCLLMMVISTIQMTSVNSQVHDLVMQQESFAASQKRLEKTTTDSSQEVVKKVEETKAKLDDVVDAAPKKTLKKSRQ